MNAQDWLVKMSQSMKVLNYQGTVAFFKNGRLDTMKYFHSFQNGQEQERLLSLNSPMREVIRESGKVSCFFRESKKVVVDHRPVSESFIVDLPQDFSALQGIYDYAFGIEELIAMRPTQVISISSKDNYRFGRKIWIDKEYFLPLKVETYDLSGKALKQVVFSDIKIDHQPVFVNTDNKIENSKIKHVHHAKSSSFDESNFILKNIPPGFQVIFFMPIKMEGQIQAVDHLVISDGFSSVSVYRGAKTNDIEQGAQTLGIVNSYTFSNEQYQITALGEVPEETVRFIAHGFTSR